MPLLIFSLHLLTFINYDSLQIIFSKLLFCFYYNFKYDLTFFFFFFFKKKRKRKKEREILIYCSKRKATFGSYNIVNIRGSLFYPNIVNIKLNKRLNKHISSLVCISSRVLHLSKLKEKVRNCSRVDSTM
jgi:hypothetical protein